MANRKKRRRPTQPGSSGPARGTAVGTKPSANKSAPAAVRVQPGEPGGPNRQARKEEARHLREALRRKQARRRYYRIGSVVTAVLVVVVVIVFLVLNGRANSARALEAAKCGPVRVIQPYPNGQDRAHIGSLAATGGEVTKPPALSTYRSIPPVSGPHDPTPLNSGLYNKAPNLYRTIHSLEHGAVIIWYSPSAPAADIAKLTTYYHYLDHVIVAPYDYPKAGAAGRLLAGKQMVVVSWHHSMACGSVSVDAAKVFVGQYRTPTGVQSPAGYKGDAPEAGAQI